MNAKSYNNLDLREIFHLEFLRLFSRKVKQSFFALKGGSNLRFFFKSFRYSEDMDLDICDIAVYKIKDTVMDILTAASFHDILNSFGVERLIPPDMKYAKQTKTTQRFKIHLLNSSGEDLFTKIEFSRRGFRGQAEVESVSSSILRHYRLAPLLISHYKISSAITQKIDALINRKELQARDIFDLYILNSQYDSEIEGKLKVNPDKLKKASENVYQVSYEQFRDSVVAYFSAEDQSLYTNENNWDEIKLKTIGFLEELG